MSERAVREGGGMNEAETDAAGACSRMMCGLLGVIGPVDLNEYHFRGFILDCTWRSGILVECSGKGVLFSKPNHRVAKWISGTS